MPVPEQPTEAARRKQILVLNQYFPPDTSATARIAAQVVEAVADRFDVVVLAGRPSYNPAERHPYYLWRRVRGGRVTVERVGSTAFDRRRVIGRLANYISYALLALPRAACVRADAVVSMTDPPFAGILGAIAARFRRRPFFYNIRDLHPDMGLASGMLRRSAAIELWDRLHRWAMQRAKTVIVLGEDMRDRVGSKGVPAERIVVVRDGARLPQASPARVGQVTDEIRGKFSLVLLHAGNLGFYGAWETLVRGFERSAIAGAGLVFVGDGAALQSIRKYAAGSSHIRFLRFYPEQQVAEMLAAADVHVVTIRRGVEGLVVPSKVYPILAAGRPVLALASATSDVARLVRRHDCGIVADPDEPDSVAQAIECLAGDRKRLRRMGENARRAAPEFDSRVQLRRFVEVLERG